MRSRALFLALGVFVLASSAAVAAPKSRRTSKPSAPPAAASAAVREPRGPSERVRLILARLAQFAVIENGDEMSPPKP